MALTFENALGIREDAMRLRVERANVLSTNLANVDTPNFKARDIDFHAELTSRLGENDGDVRMARIQTTHQGHLDISANELGDTNRLYRTPHQMSIDGNSVEEHVEHAEFMKNSMEFQLSFVLLNGSFKGLQKAIRGE